jgi:lipid-A-disaccharide synthase
MIEIRRPLAVIFIDYPGFNLKLLQDVYSLGMTTVYHIPPKVWSHGLDRAGLLKNFCHLIISIFPFEEPFFKRLQIPVSFVGNPLCDQVDSYLVAHPQDKVPYKIGLFPGSRKSEIKNLLPLLVESFLKLWNVENKVTGALPIAKTLDPLFVKSIAIKTALSFGYSEQWLCEHLSFGKGNAYDVMATSSYAWVCSGTATLETAFFHTPMSVVYKVSPLTAYIVKKIIFVKYVSLVNLIADQEVIPEYLQENATCENLVSHARKLLTSQEAQNEMQKKLYDMKALFPKNAAQNAAKKISDCIKNYDVCSDLKYHRHRTSWNL